MTIWALSKKSIFLVKYYFYVKHKLQFNSIVLSKGKQPTDNFFLFSLNIKN